LENYISNSIKNLSNLSQAFQKTFRIIYFENFVVNECGFVGMAGIFWRLNAVRRNIVRIYGERILAIIDLWEYHPKIPINEARHP
jgi:hypothetical protein